MTVEDKIACPSQLSMMKSSFKALDSTRVQGALECPRLSLPSNGVAREQPLLPGVWMNCLTPDPQRAFTASQSLLPSTGLVNRDHSFSLWHSWLLEKSEDLATRIFILRRLPAVSDRAVGLPASGSATWAIVVTCLQVNGKKECLPRSTCVDMLG